MVETKVGEVFQFFQKASVAAVKITDGDLKTGDRVHFLGNTTDFTQVVESMQSEHKQITEAKKEDHVGIKVCERVRPGDMIYKIE